MTNCRMEIYQKIMDFMLLSSIFLITISILLFTIHLWRGL